MATLPQLPPGIYRIVDANNTVADSNHLTDEGGRVTLLPPGAKDDPRQEVLHHFYDELDCLSLTSPL